MLDVALAVRRKATHDPTRHSSKQGLYDPRYEHDACGIGFVVNVKGAKSHEIVDQALTVLENLDHRGAADASPKQGDGAGILMQVPHAFFRAACADIGLALPRRDSMASA